MLSVLHGQLRTEERAQGGDQSDGDELLGVVCATIHGVPPGGESWMRGFRGPNRIPFLWLKRSINPGEHLHGDHLLLR